MMDKRLTPITPENLIQAGFVESPNSPHIFGMKKLFLKYSGIAWQICTKEGYLTLSKYWREVNPNHDIPSVEILRKINEYENSPFYQHKRYYLTNGKYQCLDEV